MTNTSVFATMLLGMTFAANAKVSKSLKKVKDGSNVDDAILAAEAKTTKAYKTDVKFASVVDGILTGKMAAEAPKPEPKKVTTTRNGEYR